MLFNVVDDVQKEYDRMTPLGAEFTTPLTKTTGSTHRRVEGQGCGNLVQLVALDRWEKNNEKCALVRSPIRTRCGFCNLITKRIAELSEAGGWRGKTLATMREAHQARWILMSSRNGNGKFPSGRTTASSARARRTRRS